MLYSVNVRDGYFPGEGASTVAEHMSLGTAEFLAKGLSSRNHDGTFEVVREDNGETKSSWKHGVNADAENVSAKQSKLYR